MLHRVPGIVTAGHGVASGIGRDRRYPAGTICLQQPLFLERGIDLSPFFSGTLNVDLAPWKPVPDNPVFDDTIQWFDAIEERFLLSPAEVEVEGEAGGEGRRYAGLWYYPHPATKPAHSQPNTVVELLLPWIEGIQVGSRVLVTLGSRAACDAGA